MITHCVLFALRPETDVAAPVALLNGLLAEIPGMLTLTYGPNRDYEAKSAGYTFGLVITFADRASLAAYDVHPDHKAAGGLLVAGSVGGADGVFVADIES